MVDDYLIIEFQINLAAIGVEYQLQSCSDLLGWVDAAGLEMVSTTNNGDGTATVRYRSLAPFGSSAERGFFRLRVSG